MHLRAAPNPRTTAHHKHGLSQLFPLAINPMHSCPSKHSAVPRDAVDLAEGSSQFQGLRHAFFLRFCSAEICAPFVTSILKKVSRDFLHSPEGAGSRSPTSLPNLCLLQPAAAVSRSIGDGACQHCVSQRLPLLPGGQCSWCRTVRVTPRRPFPTRRRGRPLAGAARNHGPPRARADTTNVATHTRVCRVRPAFPLGRVRRRGHAHARRAVSPARAGVRVRGSRLEARGLGGSGRDARGAHVQPAVPGRGGAGPEVGVCHGPEHELAGSPAGVDVSVTEDAAVFPLQQ